MKEEIAAIRATVSSPDRTVTVTAGPGGTVFDIRLSEQVMQSTPQVVSGSVMTTLRLAVAEGARQQAAIVQRYMGDRMNIIERVMATQQELLGDKKEAEPNRRGSGGDHRRFYGSDE
jgi:DNA-binding protein YbaB